SDILPLAMRVPISTATLPNSSRRTPSALAMLAKRAFLPARAATPPTSPSHSLSAAPPSLDLAEEEVLRLDPVRALVDAGDPAVADELLDAELFDVAVAAEDLHGRRAELKARLARVGL